MSSQCIVPDWNNVRHQKQEQLQPHQTTHHLHHVDNQPIPNSHLVPMSSNYEVAELTWENGQLAMHGHGAFLPTKPTWCRTNDTLESIVHQATTTFHPPPENITFSDQKTTKNTSKRARPDSGQEQCADPSACGSLKTKSAYANSVSGGRLLRREEECEGKEETVRSHSTRRSRAADVHNQSERKRRDRINQKMRALQKLVPNASKTDKASMLDEVIEYLKQLQAQIQMMSMRNIPQMMMPIGMQQHLQMSLMARMGMGLGLGMGMGMLDIPTPPPLIHHPMPASGPANPVFVPSPFSIPATMIPTHSSAQVRSEVPPNANPYCAMLAQSMNMDMYNKMAALYQQQASQATHMQSNPSRKNHLQRD